MPPGKRQAGGIRTAPIAVSDQPADRSLDHGCVLDTVALFLLAGGRKAGHDCGVLGPDVRRSPPGLCADRLDLQSGQREHPGGRHCPRGRQYCPGVHLQRVMGHLPGVLAHRVVAILVDQMSKKLPSDHPGRYTGGPEPPTDLVINTAKLTPSAAADLIIDALTSLPAAALGESCKQARPNAPWPRQWRP